MEVRWKTVNGYMTGEVIGSRGNYWVVKLKNGKQVLVRKEEKE